MAVKRAFVHASAFEEAIAPRPTPRWRTKGHATPVQDAAHFVAGALLEYGFRLFHNGGLPLLERSDGVTREEILLVPVPTTEGTAARSLIVRVHLGHRGVQELRRRYWPSVMRAPLALASGNLGQLDLPPTWTIYDLEDREPDFSPIARDIRDLALPWFALFHDPDQLPVSPIDAVGVALLEPFCALEWVLEEYGRGEAMRLMGHLLETGHLSPSPRLARFQSVFRLQSGRRSQGGRDR